DTSLHPHFSLFFFFDDPATTEIYTLSLHDALPISDRNARAQPFRERHDVRSNAATLVGEQFAGASDPGLHLVENQQQPMPIAKRSEEHTSELQSPYDLVCRLLLEKKKKIRYNHETC